MYTNDLMQAAIRKELNEYKSSEMSVHEDSRHLTRSVYSLGLCNVLEWILGNVNKFN